DRARTGHVLAGVSLDQSGVQLLGSPPRVVLPRRDDQVFHLERDGVRRRLRSPRALDDSSQLVAAFAVSLDPRVTALSTDAEHAAELGHVDEATLGLVPA